MKRIFFGIIIFIFISWIVTYFLMPSQKRDFNLFEIEPTVSPTIVSKAPTLVAIEGKTYGISAFSENDSSKISIVANYEKRLSSGSISASHSCKSLINGGFYDTDYTPLGLFIEGGETKSSWEASSLFNGVFYIGADNLFGISRTLPDADIHYALQSGPILVENGTALPLQIREDENARRSVVAKSFDGTVHFLSVYNPESVYEGPLLSELPEVVSLYAKESNLSFDSAMNLDGGSASFFDSDGTILSELVSAGSVICVQ